MTDNLLNLRGPETARIVDDVIRQRRTEKILALDHFQWQPSDDELRTGDQLVHESLEVARWAPFHFPRNQDGLQEPWRARWLRRASCLELAERMPEWNPALTPGHKFPPMLRACGSCVIVSWLPETEIQPAEKQIQVNEEHLAATAAFVQNFLIALEARGLGSYWASGNVVLEGELPERLTVDRHEKITAVVFVNYRPELPEETMQRIPGKLRDKRDPQLGWLTSVELT